MKSFAKQSGLRTMSISDTDLEYLVSNNKEDLSFYDKYRVNRYYECTGEIFLLQILLLEIIYFINSKPIVV